MAQRIIYDTCGIEIAREELDQQQACTSVDAVKAEAQRRIGALFGGKTGSALIFAELNALADGVYPTDAVASIRAASNTIEARLATDPYLDPATQPDWPEIG